MDRREVIKKIGFSFGTATLAPSLLSVLNGCDFKEEGWQPKFLSHQEYDMTEKITDIFIPVTEIPGAKELNLTRFIDAHYELMLGSKEQENMKFLMKEFSDMLLEKTSKKKLDKVVTSEYENQLSRLLKADKEDRQKWQKSYNDYTKKLSQGETIKPLSKTINSFIFLNGLRQLSIWGFRNSEYIGEKVLAYDPVPGQQKGCVDLMETTGGKSWSI
ncbi:MAG: gluconate 2-dehydrogenase subunit 3 family protein [Bacteroidota bacterium]|nr:gluconate 2-dehydrogenase subunit 3 family protein [Bacteroidota bacterium]